MMTRATILSMLMALLAVAGCSHWVMWEPAPAKGLQAPPPPQDSLERRDGDFEDDDEGEGLIPRSVLFGNPDKIRARLSPDGKRIVFLAPDDGVLNVWVAPADDFEAAKVVLDHLQVMSLGESLGGVETLISHPASMTHASVPPEERAKIGIGDGLVRVSVGIEDLDDLLGDLGQALDSI